MRKTDRRVERTKRLLKESLFELILAKGYDSVKIEEITDRADLGRTTFYLHYRDKEQLLLESIEAIAQELIDQVFTDISPTSPKKVQVNAEEFDVTTPVLEVFRHASENAKLYRIILRGEGAYPVSNRLHQIISATVLEIIQFRVQYLNLSNIKMPLDLISNFFAGSLLSLVTWWLENDMPYSPEKMAFTFRKLVFEGLIDQLITS